MFSVNHHAIAAQWSTAYFYITRVEYDSPVIQIAEAKPTEIIQKPGRAGNSTGVEARVGRNFRVAFSVPSSEGRPSHPFCFPRREFLPGSRTAASFAGGGSQTLSSNDASCPEMARVVPGRKCDTYVCERIYTGRACIGATDGLAYLLRAIPTLSRINSPVATLAIIPETILYLCVISVNSNRFYYISTEF